MNSFQRLECVIPREFWSDLYTVTGGFLAESVSKPTFTSKILKNASTDQYSRQSNSPDENSMKSKINVSHYL